MKIASSTLQTGATEMRRSTRFFLLSVVMSMFSVPAMAADFPAIEPALSVVSAPAFSWTGFYVGGEVGWMKTDPQYTAGVVLLGDLSLSRPDRTRAARRTKSWPVTTTRSANSCWASGDLQGWTVGKMRYTAVTEDFLTAHSKWGGSIRGRLGYAVDRTLLYVNGGAAFASNEVSIPFTGIWIGGDDTRFGWTVGAGLDYAFTDNWFTGVEYRYSQFEAKSFVYPIPVLKSGRRGSGDN